MLLRNVSTLYGSCGVCCCEMYLHCTVAAVYAVAKYMFNVRWLRYMLLRNICIIYGAAVYDVAKCMYNVR